MLLAVLAALLLFFLDGRFDFFKPIRSVLATAVYPVQNLAAAPVTFGDWLQDLFQSRDDLRQRITALEAQNLTQSVRLQRLHTLERENLRLRELLGSSFRLQERVQIAELVSVDLDPFYQHVIIDKGGQFGVYEGQPVLDSRGVMGQVAEVSQFSSRVVLLTDPSHSVPVQVVRNGLRAVATGRGLGEPLQLEFLPRNVDIREGDLLVTSGLGERFPVGYPVGKVIAINFPPGKAFAQITVEPAAQLATSRELMLVLPGEKIDVGLTVAEDAELAVELEQNQVVDPDKEMQAETQPDSVSEPDSEPTTENSDMRGDGQL
ncbi:Rod shape-determining protein MreC [Methylophaga frappieri]|uniref:Cell shape-determining protein MreC n=2 Tax=Methylophaga frappieri (strain ATCC BAA-2434 / DSM 25690 / JAM7) TaxID=754477 RepID=I1YHD9_METFJ|nr:Rod shape-determining protein MreC [Methylophaga frappieri]